MPITTRDTNVALAEYFRRCAVAYPRCCLAALNEPGGGRRQTDERLAHLLSLGRETGPLLAYCDPCHVRALTWRFAGLVFDPSVTDDPERRPATRRLTADECATAMGVPRSAWRRLITEARDRVRRAMEERLATVQRRVAA